MFGILFEAINRSHNHVHKKLLRCFSTAVFSYATKREFCKKAQCYLEFLQRFDVQPPERLVPLGIMGARLRYLMKPPGHPGQYCIDGFKGGFQLGAHYAERQEPLRGSMRNFELGWRGHDSKSGLLPPGEEKPIGGAINTANKYVIYNSDDSVTAQWP